MTNNKISDLISSQSPFHVRNNHPLFISFLEAYYQFLEQSNNTIDRAHSLQSYIDIDETYDDIAEKFYERFMKYIPIDMLADKNKILKNIKDFYRAKGTEKGLKFLLRVLFGKEAKSIYYPKRDILRASDGKWFIQKSLRIADYSIDGIVRTSFTDLQKFISTRISGVSSGASAIVERVNRFYETDSLINELFLTSIDGNFVDGDPIIAYYNDENGSVHTISANVSSDILQSITINPNYPGSDYEIGDEVIIESDTGSGATAIVSDVSTGNILSISVLNGGAGFQVNNYILFSGGGGTGANAKVSVVSDDNIYHQNTYNLMIGTIELEANTLISNAVYSNLIAANANTTLANSLTSIQIGPLGPIHTIVINNAGVDYETTPTADAIANTELKSLGILGRMNIVSGGTEYRVGNIIEFIGDVGYGANARVSSVNVSNSNTITSVEFTDNVGWVKGGFGYSQSALPTTNVVTTTGSGANITVTAILGDGERLLPVTDTIGRIEGITILTRGTNYRTTPTINLTQSGDGLARANSTILSAGIFTYPGRYINDDGHLSALNYLQDRDYYQEYSYVIRIAESLDNYMKALKELNHPAGMKLFGEYLYTNETTNAVITIENTTKTIFVSGATYSWDNVSNIITVTKTAHGVTNANSSIYLEVIDGGLSNGRYFIRSIPNANTIRTNNNIHQANTSGNTYLGVTI